MTGMIDKLYEETYNGRLLEIYRFTQSMPGVVTASSITARVDGYELPSQFACCTYEPFSESTARGGLPTLEYASALAAAKAYCDYEAETLAQRGDEQLALPLTYREAKTLLHALDAAPWQERLATREVHDRLDALLQAPAAVRETHSTNLIARALTKLRRLVGGE
ncbi:hypothetical protein H6F86_14765 [Phormidium sp. FACHB-592]|uniref:Uncharacterized protein n=1 Tax=Stenomitos frigidus AS-A4 TaxID=2933935 RepID=A0ABV0KLS4_9CYAN|nr:hypothetical protein [Phormidium sp. FACHB-592]MBD2075133.1 hypothetical protein [Phormidium sp. FACHB-592]